MATSPDEYLRVALLLKKIDLAQKRELTTKWVHRRGEGVKFRDLLEATVTNGNLDMEAIEGDIARSNRAQRPEPGKPSKPREIRQRTVSKTPTPEEMPSPSSGSRPKLDQTPAQTPSKPNKTPPSAVAKTPTPESPPSSVSRRRFAQRTNHDPSSSKPQSPRSAMTKNPPPSLNGSKIHIQVHVLELVESGPDRQTELYKGRISGLGKPVAVKVVRVMRGDLVDRLSEISRKIMRLNHPAIVQVYDWSRTVDFQRVVTHTIVTELVNGENLASKLREEKTLPLEEAIRIGRSVASALSFSHRRDIFHGAVTEKNILISTENEVKVTDFGVSARMLNKKSNPKTDVSELGELLRRMVSPERKERGEAKSPLGKRTSASHRNFDKLIQEMEAQRIGSQAVWERLDAQLTAPPSSVARQKPARVRAKAPRSWKKRMLLLISLGGLLGLVVSVFFVFIMNGDLQTVSAGLKRAGLNFDQGIAWACGAERVLKESLEGDQLRESMNFHGSSSIADIRSKISEESEKQIRILKPLKRLRGDPTPWVKELEENLGPRKERIRKVRKFMEDNEAQISAIEGDRSLNEILPKLGIRQSPHNDDNALQQSLVDIAYGRAFRRVNETIMAVNQSGFRAASKELLKRFLDIGPLIGVKLPHDEPVWPDATPEHQAEAAECFRKAIRAVERALKKMVPGNSTGDDVPEKNLNETISAVVEATAILKQLECLTEGTDEELLLGSVARAVRIREDGVRLLECEILSAFCLSNSKRVLVEEIDQCIRDSKGPDDAIEEGLQTLLESLRQYLNVQTEMAQFETSPPKTCSDIVRSTELRDTEIRSAIDRFTNTLAARGRQYDAALKRLKVDQDKADRGLDRILEKIDHSTLATNERYCYEMVRKTRELEKAKDRLLAKVESLLKESLRVFRFIASENDPQFGSSWATLICWSTRKVLQKVTDIKPPSRVMRAHHLKNTNQMQDDMKEIFHPGGTLDKDKFRDGRLALSGALEQLEKALRSKR